jgi:DNA-binding GntR family transcriptional regulator
LTDPEQRQLTPAYLRIASDLKSQIEKGDLRPGDRLPSESGLSKKYNVSPMTARRATQALLDQGIISAIKGSGTYVRAPDLRAGTFAMEEFYDIISDEKRTKVKVLEALIEKAEQKTAQKLSLPRGARTILIRRLIIRDGEPLIYHREYLIYDPEMRIVETELEVTSLRGLFVGREENMLKSGQLSIEATVLAKEEADLLNTHAMQPAFRLEHLFYNYEDKPVSWGRFICRGDRFRFTTTLGHFKGKASWE